MVGKSMDGEDCMDGSTRKMDGKDIRMIAELKSNGRIMDEKVTKCTGGIWTYVAGMDGSAGKMDGKDIRILTKLKSNGKFMGESDTKH